MAAEPTYAARSDIVIAKGLPSSAAWNTRWLGKSKSPGVVALFLGALCEKGEFSEAS
jgi:hypothetical protein